MKPQFPFKDKYKITQGYNENNHDYTGGRHGALDIVPFDANGVKFPANIYPVFNGSTISIQDTSVTRGKGIKERVICDAGLIAYLKEKNLVPKDYPGQVRLEILYWHVLEVLDYDGTLTQDTPIAKCGNTGKVFTGGKPVPDNEKGQPPYPGLHLHIEGKLYAGNKLLNTDKDVLGRIDLNTIFAYKGTMNDNIRIFKNGSEYIVGSRTVSEAGLAQKLFDANAQNLLTTDGKPNFAEIDKIAIVL